MTKLIPIGLCTIRNEERDIEGWAKMLAHFCDRVIALVDPATSDTTEKILKEKCPYVEIEYQDRSLGDSDEDTQGSKACIIMHVNKTKWIQENVPDESWFLEIAADERFHPWDWPRLEHEIKYAQKFNFDAIEHRFMYEPVPIDMAQFVYKEYGWWYDSTKPCNKPLDLGFSINWSLLSPMRHSRFQQKHVGWTQISTPHGGFKNKAIFPLTSAIPIWHFHRLKTGTCLTSSWRDNWGDMNNMFGKYKGLIPLIQMDMAFPNWQKLEVMDNSFVQENPDLDALNIKYRTDINKFLVQQETERKAWVAKNAEKYRGEKYYIWHDVKSSMFTKIGYNAVSDTVQVNMKSGHMYRYMKVPYDIWLAFSNAKSTGQFYNQIIKKNYEELKIA